MEELRIQCPSCGIVLDVRNSKNEDVKRITCPHCRKHLAITFHEPSQQEKEPVRTLYYGEAAYSLKEGDNTIGKKDPSSTAGIQIATGDSTMCLSHACVKVVRLSNGKYKYVVFPLHQEFPVLIGKHPLSEGDEVVLELGEELQLGETVLILR